MNDTFITQCPHCQTSFRVKPAQLEVARGAVRCGACLKVFKAAQHKVGDSAPRPSTPASTAPATAPAATAKPAAASTPATTPPPRPTVPAPSTGTVPAQPAAKPVAASNVPPARPSTAAAQPTPSPTAAPTRALSTPATPSQAPAKPSKPEPDLDDSLLIHDDLDLSDLDLDEEIAKLEAQELSISQEFLNLSSAPTPAKQLLGDEIDDSDDDERWAEALLKAEEDRQEPTFSSRPSGIRQVKTPSTPSKLAAKEAVERLQAAQVDQLFASKAPTGVRKPKNQPLRAERDDSGEHDDAEEIILTTPGAPASKTASTRYEPSLQSQSLYEELDDEPLQLHWRKPKRRWGRALFWTSLNLIAAAALLGQYTWYNFEALSRQDAWRPWLEQACPHVGCELPARIDPSLIKSSNLVVRSHPEFSGALVVDAILYNRADYAQPFPMLELRFADINNQLLASRRFKPNEYLGGELAGAQSMPPQTPIHISLDILDPGSKAVNYSLSFSAPE